MFYPFLFALSWIGSVCHGYVMMRSDGESPRDAVLIAAILSIPVAALIVGFSAIILGLSGIAR